MKLIRHVVFPALMGMAINFGLVEAYSQMAQSVVVSQPVSLSPPSPNGPVEAATLAWDADWKTIAVHSGDAEGHLFFSFTNVSKQNVVILDVRAGCHCTTFQVPPMPWTNAPGTNGQIEVKIDTLGKAGTLYKNLFVTTDKGVKQLNFTVYILPVELPQMTTETRMNNLKLAATDRQAVFKNDCVACHVKPGEGKYGKELYDADCGICHEGEHRSTMVPDLHALKVATNPDFWTTWITHGKPGTLMPAFSSADGGPLSDMQIKSLVVFLNFTIPSKPSGTN